MRTLLFTLPFALVACRGGGVTDVDGDGSIAGIDCNDQAANIHPAAPETCDGIDENCNGTVDDNATDGTTFYIDGDGDNYGNESASIVACEAPTGYVADSTDCNDGDGDIHPGAAETECTDPTDYNCDGSSGFLDGDGDGYAACQDCDDTTFGVNPGAAEVCDGIDGDCDGAIDEPGSQGESFYFADDDSDGFGDANQSVSSCSAPEGYVNDSTDCNDTSAQAFPGGVEVCDALDNNCDGQIDNSASDATPWYADGDNDGFGENTVKLIQCNAPDGFVSDNTDCDDADVDTFPGATEACDEADNNCDGTTDEGFDADSDGFISCQDDCDDGNADTHPGADEICDSADNDCDGVADEGAVDEPTWYVDFDEDGFGSDRFTQSSCTQPAGWSATADDCDDGDATFNPGADLGCDGTDRDCDGVMDNDADGDGFADAACGGDDCDDANEDTKPEVGGNCAMGSSCLDILEKGLDDGDGQYMVDVDGFETGDDPFLVECDMTRDGGGWTLGVKSWHSSGGGHYRNINAVGSVDDALTKKGNNYKLSDAQIRAIIGESENFDFLADQAGYNSYYSTGNFEYIVARNYTGYWRYDRDMGASSTTTSFHSFRLEDDAMIWEGNLNCGSTNGGAGINCDSLASGSPSPAGGAGCDVALGRFTSGGWNHVMMARSNQDTYLYMCNGAQHSSSYDLNHRWWFRTHVE